MHQVVARAFEEIDAAVFSGDEFHTDRADFNIFKEYVERWARALPSTEDALIYYEEEHGGRLFKRGQLVKVVDDECSLHGKLVTIVDVNPKCTAEWEVRTEGGVLWIIHSCRLRAA
jgi:hypothetical protein